MARRRFFVDRVHNGHAEIQGDDAHHLTRVLRVEAGQKFEISDTERVWLAAISALRKDRVEFEVLEELDPGSPLPDMTLYLALIKFEKFEWAVEKATELGVTKIVPVEAARSERGLFDGAKKRADRWIRIAREASEQCRRLRAPAIVPAIHLREVAADDAPQRFWLDERPGAQPLMAVFRPGPGERASFLIGPEGGWTDAERDIFSAAGRIPASLGPLVLRAETAVCATLAIAAQAWLSVAPLQSGQ